ncbi:MAG: tRNA (N6-threonylcarbamoyladenosine(37)-N6)-methyltransferase TrmO [Pyrobaculum sp.]|uniref:tRNA (N6-threonylcarbamoyladenosine(37)-N6)-methyltransferase TrmO n=1 Tax=Pyrobaculum sp. TaxID=2004705 RepID=UPI00315F88A3
MSCPICLRPIGVVEVGLPRFGRVDKYSFVSVIRVYDEYAEGLAGLEDYSHAFVLWYFHETRGVRLRLRPWGREDFPEVGIFATRFTQRPNPLALTIVKIVEVDPPRLRVMGLDAWSGSPVLDIKPYDHLDVVNEFRTPDWFEEFFKSLGGLPEWLGPSRR